MSATSISGVSGMPQFNRQSALLASRPASLITGVKISFSTILLQNICRAKTFLSAISRAALAEASVNPGVVKSLGRGVCPPRYKRNETFPFIPTEAKIDKLIASCGKVAGTYLQGLKETGADPGEFIRIEWTDINRETNTITINHPVKGHNPRVLQVSAELIRRLEAFPRKSERVFKTAEDDKFTARVAHNVKEACDLIEVGFEYVTGGYNDGGKIFRKRN